MSIRKFNRKRYRFGDKTKFQSRSTKKIQSAFDFDGEFDRAYEMFVSDMKKQGNGDEARGYLNMFDADYEQFIKNENHREIYFTDVGDKFKDEGWDEMTETEQSEYLKIVYDLMMEEKKYNLRYLLSEMVNNIRTSDMLLYRKINLERFEDLRQSDLGIYWADDESIAETHWTGDGEEYTITTALDDPRQIDMNKTISARMHYELGDLEAEITLKKNSPVNIISIKNEDGKEMLKQDTRMSISKDKINN